jgi:hypothetical protein
MANEEQIPAYNPLNEEVIIRSHSTPVINAADTAPIPEADIPIIDESSTNTTAQETTNPNPGNGTTTGTNAPNPQPAPPKHNPITSELPKKEQKIAAETMANAAIDGYSRLCKFFNGLILISPKKIDRAIVKGEIDANLALPMAIDGAEQHVPLNNFIAGYNEQLNGVLEVTDEFKNEFKPVLVRVLMKNNIGMTDEQNLLYQLAIDAGLKASIAYKISQQNRELLKTFKELSSNPEYSTRHQSPPNPTNNAPFEETQPPTPPTDSDVDYLRKAEEKFTDEAPLNRNTTKPQTQDAVPLTDPPTNFEPEVEVYNSGTMFAQDKSRNTFADAVIIDSMPVFGNPEKLQELEKKASELNAKGQKARKNALKTKK